MVHHDDRYRDNAFVLDVESYSFVLNFSLHGSVTLVLGVVLKIVSKWNHIVQTPNVQITRHIHHYIDYYLIAYKSIRFYDLQLYV